MSNQAEHDVQPQDTEPEPCKHETLSVSTLERVHQKYYPYEKDHWGKITYQMIASVDDITCLNCGQDVTTEFIGKIVW